MPGCLPERVGDGGAFVGSGRLTGAKTLFQNIEGALRTEGTRLGKYLGNRLRGRQDWRAPLGECLGVTEEGGAASPARSGGIQGRQDPSRGGVPLTLV